MRADTQEIKKLLKEFKFLSIFDEGLGWNRPREAPSIVPYQGQRYEFTLVAEKAGFKIYHCTFQGRIPNEQNLKKIDRKLNIYGIEHLTIFADAEHENQAWLWVKKGQNQPSVARLNRLNKNQSGELLAQKIARLFVSIDEEESITLTSILDRVNQAFDVEKVTTEFYRQFQEKHRYFLTHIENITNDEDRKWYTSIMLNRLMFIYFLQRKGLLNNTSSIHLKGDREYLQNHLKDVQEKRIAGTFYEFLRRLFHEGLNLPEGERNPEMKKIIGNIPYINGGIFDVHILEKRYRNIQIEDSVFESLFELFEDFDWHLDDRPMRSGNEINPDVLGYIFEKYINQKQMGAYYTKEDITEYISKNTIVPFLFKKVALCYPDAFAADGQAWSLLRDNPDDYIYEEMAHGLLEPLPLEIEAGIEDIGQRTCWNKAADEQWALLTETWREVVDRRHRYIEMQRMIVEGKISSINDVVLYNLNITQFARDVIATCKESGLLRTFYETLEQVTVLDPTCGSGAFLFAALNTLKPLYQICIQRMKELVFEYEQQQTESSTTQSKDDNHILAFREILDRVNQHRNQTYYILKSIIINNLYGVDIMEEAIEICKLRLFLKLVAQIKTPQELEPLPDIDFNMLVGNTLIGFTSLDEIRKVVTTKLVKVGNTEETLQRIEKDAKEIERDEHNFRGVQTAFNTKIDPEEKEKLRIKLEHLRDELDPYLATEYGIYKDKYPDRAAYKKAFTQWKKSHQPFHWWAEFYKIMRNGGFDVVIGNPPYVEYHEIRNQYIIQRYKTEECGNLYAFCVEKMRILLGQEGRFGVIIPVASVCTDRYLTLQKFLTRTGNLIISSYNDRPSKLFEGLEHIRLTIILYSGSDGELPSIFTTKYNKWNKDEREDLFNKLAYTESTAFVKSGSIPKLQFEFERDILQKVLTQKKTLSYYARNSSNNLIYYTRKLSGFVQVLDHIPIIYDDQGQEREPSELKSIAFETAEIRDVFLSILNSNVFYWFLTIYSDCRNLNKREIYTMRFDFERASQENIQALTNLSHQLMKDLKDHSKMLPMKYEKLGELHIQCFYPKYSKLIIDEIDRILSQHYRFTPEELDYIVNYDIKYRMGRDRSEENEVNATNI